MKSFEAKPSGRVRLKCSRSKGHPKAQKAYAWAHYDGDKDQEIRFVAMLEIPPVKDAKTAVQASIMAAGKR